MAKPTRPSGATSEVDLDAEELTPAQADAELMRRGPALAGLGDDDEIERLAAIADQGDEEVAEREMPGWTAEQRVEQIEDWRRKRRRTARYGMRPGETVDEWRERRIAQMVAEHGCAPLLIPASRLEDVVEIDLAKLSRRDRKRLYKSGGFKWLHHERRHVLRVARPRSRRTAARRAAGLRSGQDPGDDGGEPEPGDSPGFERFHSLTAGLSGAERLELFGALPADAQDAYWRHLARELEEGRS